MRWLPLKVAIWAIPAIFVIFGIICRLLLQAAPRAIALDLAQPLPVATNWLGFGFSIWAIFAAAVLGAAVAYAAVLWNLLRAPIVPKGILLTIMLGGLAALAAAFVSPLIFSSDVYAYGAYGVMSLHGIDPYAHLKLATTDPMFAAAIWQWSNPPPICVYGPVFVWIAKTVVMLFAPGGVFLQLLGLRILAAGSLLVCGPLFYLALADYPVQQRLAGAAGVLLNPLAIWTAAEGHNDALMLAIVLLGFVVLRRFGYGIGAFVIAASTVIKAPAVAAAAVLAVFAFRRRARFAAVLTGTFGGLVLSALISLRFAWGVRNVLIPHGHYTPQFSLQYLFSELLAQIAPHNASALSIGVVGALAVAAITALYGLRLALRGRREGACYLALAVWLAIPNPYPWYALWILPVAFLAIESRGALAIIVASLTIAVRYLPDVAFANSLDLNLAVTLCAFAAPAYILLSRPWPQPAPEGNR
ncbi:MAG: hypothetical protein ABI182_09205 [Candidatus Baltobacteraceae bacterium]